MTVIKKKVVKIKYGKDNENTMRISFKKSIIILFLIFVSIVTWNVLLKQSDVYTQTCNHSESFQQQLHALTERVHDVLRTLNLTHFLCYGTLWGQIRLSRVLPWEDKTVMCLLNEELTTKDEVFISRMFTKADLNLAYDSTEGQYIVTPINQIEKMTVFLIVFELDKVVDMYRRIGWKRRLLPPACENLQSLDCFPPRLIRPPLLMKEFSRALLPVPREGIELQKYHYKDNWWKEIIIKNC